MANVILPWIAYNGGMVARWLISLGASCYLIAAIVVLPLWMSTWHVPLAAWWAAYLAAEALILGALVTVGLWWYVWRAGAGTRRYVPSRVAGLTAMTLVPMFGFFVIPIGCWVSVRSRAGDIAGWAVFAACALALIALWAYSRYARKP